ncbi:uncharacterized protein [Haliotis asinina]|uniref:uncharacterized protein n=1 Tax=Haliotis asinina TaxID=109174 RepID=UPI003531F7CB
MSSVNTEETVTGDVPNGVGTTHDDTTRNTGQIVVEVTLNTSQQHHQDSTGQSAVENAPGKQVFGEDESKGQSLADPGNRQDTIIGTQDAPAGDKSNVARSPGKDISDDTSGSGDSKGMPPVVVPAVGDTDTILENNAPSLNGSSEEHTTNGSESVPVSNQSGGAKESMPEINLGGAVRETANDSRTMVAVETAPNTPDEMRHDEKSSADGKPYRRKTPTSSVSYPTTSTIPPSRLPLIRSAHAHIQSLQAPNAPRGFEHKQVTRSRVPPRFIRLATVTMAPKSKTISATPSLYYEEPRRPTKVITWEEANNSRPPLKVDMEGPSPWTYSPRNKPLNETNAPAWTFGARCSPEREGGSRTSWAKTWFQTPHVWHTKVDFVSDGTWPTPNLYKKRSLLGPRQRTMPESPSYSMGRKGDFSVMKQGSDKEPSPGEYDTHHADRALFRRHPAYSHQFRREGTILWSSGEDTPGPGSYTPTSCTRPHGPSFSIQGIRREKSHVLGPYSSF